MQIGLYVHIPFCISKCYYCDFLSFPESETMHQRYIEALCLEIKSIGQSLPANTVICSIFIGGGTPTVLSPVLLEKLMQTIMEQFHLTSTCEWTIEANPGTITPEKINVLNDYPITRISLGLQSTNDRLLQRIGRIHRFKDWQESMTLIQSLTNWQINADLMFALPDQSFEDFKKDLATVVRYDLDHLSLYALIIEEGTPFYTLYEQKEIEPASDELDRKMYHYAQDYLNKKNYHQYEISNWAKKGCECRHNLIYWNCEPYIGVGLGAHSCYQNKRFYNEKDLRSYLQNSACLDKIRYDEEILTPKLMMEEFMFLGLRKLEGINIKEFERRFNCSIWQIYGEVLKTCIRDKLLVYTRDKIYLTHQGLDVCNSVFIKFLE